MESGSPRFGRLGEREYRVRDAQDLGWSPDGVSVAVAKAHEIDVIDIKKGTVTPIATLGLRLGGVLLVRANFARTRFFLVTFRRLRRGGCQKRGE
jgi:hypothetical protein